MYIACTILIAMSIYLSNFITPQDKKKKHVKSCYYVSLFLCLVWKQFFFKPENPDNRLDKQNME
jgi:tryptophan-rich sensory protein